MRKKYPKPSLSNLPIDVLLIILTKVARDSHVDTLSCMASCKTIRDTTNYPEVLRELSLNDVVTTPYERIPTCMRFLEACAKHGNLYAMFLCGLFYYFHLNRRSEGMNSLKNAAEETHSEAMYLYGFNLIACNDFNNGCNFLKQLWRNQGIDVVRQCRRNLKRVVLEISVREYREFDVLLSILEDAEECAMASMEVVCDECFVRKEIYLFLDYFY